MTPGERAFFTYARKREGIRVAREAGAAWPWTDDITLQDFRFCNVFRRDDKVTRWYIENMVPYFAGGDLFFATYVFRFISRIETMKRISDLLYLDRFSRDLLAARLRMSSPIVTAAYMVKTPTGMDKAAGLAEIAGHAAPVAWRLARLAARSEATLEGLHGELVKLPFCGKFIAYEVVTDLSYTKLLAHASDLDTWASAGPGAARGLARVYEGGLGNAAKWNSPQGQHKMIAQMRCLLALSRELPEWQGRPWTMREVEHTLCEFDKYERARLGQGRPKQLYRRETNAITE